MSQPATCDLSIIIVNWNTRELLAECLQSVISSQLSVTDNCPVITETLVVDNASADGSAAMVRERFPWVRLIESQENLGFAAGNNLALRQATGKNLLLLNPDTVVTEGALDLLLHVIEAIPDAAIVGAQLLNADGSPQMSIGAFPSLWSELPMVNRVLRPVHRTYLMPKVGADFAVQSVDWVSGACLMIRREVVEAIGPLDENFWLYTEEADWCCRARVAGWEVLSVPQAQVYHLARAASRQRFEATMLHFYQSKVRFVHKHRGTTHASLIKAVLQAKAAVWRRRPAGSPLKRAYPDLPLPDISRAYEKLSQTLVLPLPDYLASHWY